MIAEAVDLARRRATREHARPDGARAGRLGAESWLRPGACAGRGSGAGATAVPRAGPRSGSRGRPNANGLNEERHRVRMHAARPLAAPVVAVERLPSSAPPVAVSQKYQRGNGSAARYGRALALFTGEVRWRSGPMRVLWRRSRFGLARSVLHVPHRSALRPVETSPLFPAQTSDVIPTRVRSRLKSRFATPTGAPSVKTGDNSAFGGLFLTGDLIVQRTKAPGPHGSWVSRLQHSCGAAEAGHRFRARRWGRRG